MQDYPSIPFVDFQWIENQLQQLKKRVLSLPERNMRHSVLLDFLSTITEEELVAFFWLIQEQAGQGQKSARDLLQELALEPTVASELSYEQLRKAYQICIDCQLPTVRAMFFANPERREDIDEAFTQNDYCNLPLGIRRSAARTTDRNQLDRLLHDRNWRVIQLLLQNPRIIERDVVSIAARRPTRPEILELISKHPKWSDRYRIRKALACNPYTPYPLARLLLPTLLKQDVKECIAMGVFSPQLQHEAEQFLQQRPEQTKYKKRKCSDQDLTEISDLANQLCETFSEFLDEDISPEPSTDQIQEEETEEGLEDFFANMEAELEFGDLIPVQDEESED